MCVAGVEFIDDVSPQAGNLSSFCKIPLGQTTCTTSASPSDPSPARISDGPVPGSRKRRELPSLCRCAPAEHSHSGSNPALAVELALECQLKPSILVTANILQ